MFCLPLEESFWCTYTTTTRLLNYFPVNHVVRLILGPNPILPLTVCDYPWVDGPCLRPHSVRNRRSVESQVSNDQSSVRLLPGLSDSELLLTCRPLDLSTVRTPRQDLEG